MILEITTAPQSILSGIRTTLGSVGLTAQETIRGEKLFTDNALLSSLTVIGTLSTYNDGTAAGWNTAYTLVCSNSAYWNAGGQLNFGTLNDFLSTNNISLSTTQVFGNLTVFGLVSSLSSVAITQIQDVSVVASTTGISITGDASFTGGVILSSGVNLLDLFATPAGAVNWDSNYTTTNANSGNWSSVYTTVCSNSASWQSVYAVTSTLYLSQSGGTINGSLYINTSGSTPGLRIANVGTADCFIVEHGSVPNLTPFVISEQGLVGIGTTTPVNDLDVRSNVGRAGNVRADGNLSASRIFSTNNQSNSDFWHSTYTTFGSNSANYVNREFVDGKFLPLSGGNISGTLTTSGTLSTRNIIVADSGSIVGQTSASTFNIGALTAREINLLHTPYNDGIDPVINIGEFDFDGIYGTRVRYDEINGRTIITGELGTLAPATTAVVIDITTGNVGIGGLPSLVPGDELTVYGNVSASGLYRGSLKYISVSSNFIAQADASYLVSTVLNGVTATLPAAPFNGDTIRFNDAFSTWNTRNFVVSSANNKIAGLFEPLICNVANVPFYLTFANPVTGWRLAFDATNITGSFNTPPSGSITTGLLADGAVTAVKLADNAVTTAKLANSSVTGSAGGGKLAASVITGQTQKTSLSSTDEFLIHSATDTALRRVAWSVLQPAGTVIRTEYSELIGNQSYTVGQNLAVATTAPTITDGVQILAINNLAPSSSSNYFIIQISAHITGATSGSEIVLMLFGGSTLLASTNTFCGADNEKMTIIYKHTPSSMSSINYTVRAACSTGTLFANRLRQANDYNTGKQVSSMLIQEIKG